MARPARPARTVAHIQMAFETDILTVTGSCCPIREHNGHPARSPLHWSNSVSRTAIRQYPTTQHGLGLRPPALNLNLEHSNWKRQLPDLEANDETENLNWQSSIHVQWSTSGYLVEYPSSICPVPSLFEPQSRLHRDIMARGLSPRPHHQLQWIAILLHTPNA
jgi:hypothetical protein